MEILPLKAGWQRQPWLVMSVIVMGEYRFGISSSKYRAEYERRVSLIEIDLPLLGANAETAVHYAAIRKEVKEAGTPIPWHDLWIAAQARQHSLPVLSRDAPILTSCADSRVSLGSRSAGLDGHWIKYWAGFPAESIRTKP
jgi:predicted nucleic acid-binding protein